MPLGGIRVLGSDKLLVSRKAVNGRLRHVPWSAVSHSTEGQGIVAPRKELLLRLRAFKLPYLGEAGMVAILLAPFANPRNALGLVSAQFATIAAAGGATCARLDRRLGNGHPILRAVVVCGLAQVATTTAAAGWLARLARLLAFALAVAPLGLLRGGQRLLLRLRVRHLSNSAGPICDSPHTRKL